MYKGHRPSWLATSSFTSWRYIPQCNIDDPGQTLKYSNQNENWLLGSQTETGEYFEPFFKQKAVEYFLFSAFSMK